MDLNRQQILESEFAHLEAERAGLADGSMPVFDAGGRVNPAATKARIDAIDNRKSAIKAQISKLRGEF